MRRKAIDLTGRRSVRLVVLGEGERNQHGNRTWLCQCDCGNTCLSYTTPILQQRAKSCGCFSRERIANLNRSHGKTKSLTYRKWANMIQRCRREPHYAHVEVCERWRSFEAFLSDMGKCPQGLTLDRIKNELGYQPGNCRWASMRTQANNRGNTKRLTMGGITKSLTEWCEELGVPYSRVRMRIDKLGWLDEDALMLPKNSRPNPRLAA